MLGIILVHAVLMSIFVFDLVDRQHDFLYKQSIQQANSLSGALATNSASWVLANDIIGLEEVLQSQINYPDLRYAIVLSPEGRVLGHTDSTKTGLYLTDNISQDLLKSKKWQHPLFMSEMLIDVAAPIVSNGEFIGWARVAMGQESNTTSLNIITRNGIFYTIAAIIIGALFAFFMAKGITSGLEHLLDVAESIKKGDSQVRSTLMRKDELGKLSDDFNLALDTINKNSRDLQAIMDHSPVVIYIKDSDGRYIFINKSYEDLFSIKNKDVTGKTDYDLFPEDVAEELQRNNKWVLETGKDLELNETVPHSDGLHTYSSIKFSLYDEDDNAYAICGISTDITRRQEMENEIALSEEKYRTLAENIPGISYRCLNDKYWTIEYINNHCLELCGYPASDFINNNVRSFSSIIHPDDVSKVDSMVNDAVNHKQPYTIEYRVVHQDGSIIWVYEKGQGMFDESGNLVSLSGVILNVTSEYEARQELLNKEHEQREILNSLVDAVITIDQYGEILTFNKAAESMFGYPGKEIIGENISHLMPEPYASHHNGYIQKYLDMGKANIMGVGQDIVGKRKDNNTFPIRISITKLPGNAGEGHRFIGACTDLTILKQQEDIIRRSQKMDALGKLTGGIAHDYNNMLGIVIGYAELLKSALNNQPSLAKYADEIKYAGERGSRLTQKLLAFSKQKIVNASKLDLNSLLKDGQHMLEKTLTARIQLILDLSENLWPVYLDRGDFEDSIINVCINSMHAIDGNGQLIIKTKNKSLETSAANILDLSAGDYVEISITDTGHGIDSTIISNIFDPFYTTKGEAGTGLGLSQVYGFIKRSGGGIEVHSESGIGAQITFYFPRCVTDTTMDDIDGLNKSNDNANLAGKELVLLVDDEPALIGMAREMLTQEGYTVYSSENAREALVFLEKTPVDLLITDIIMPEMNGYELASIVQEKYPTIKIQLVSGFGDDQRAGKADEKLYKDRLQKPYNSQQLYSSIRKLLDE